MTRMADEISQIPTVVGRLLDDGRQEVRAAAAAIRTASPRWVVGVGRGSSDHAATYARYMVETELGLPAGLAAPAVTTLYGARLEWRDALVIAVSQSGASPDVAETVAAARAGGALTVAITNEPHSPLAAEAAHVLLCRAGIERSVAATKTYVASLVVVAALVDAVGGTGRFTDSFRALPETLGTVLEGSVRWMDGGVSAAFASSDRAFVVSRGHNLPTALETALKLKETAGVFADGYSTADFEHGPIVLANHGVEVLAFRPAGQVALAIDPVLDRLAGRGVEPWVVTDGVEDGADGASRRLRLPAVAEPLSPISFAIPGLLLAEAVAVQRGFDPDAPAGLEKVTLTR